MKYKLIKDNRFLPLKGYAAIALYPFIFVNTSTSNWKYNKDRLMNHEKIHLKQQLELLIIPFYIIYIVEYLINSLKYKSGNKAYRNISFEREAYDNESNPDYLKSRKFFSWISYLKGKG